MFSNLYDACLGVFMCIEELKECDFWKTSAYDPVGHLLYFQIHVEDSLQMFDNSMVSKFSLVDLTSALSLSPPTPMS